MGKLDTSNWKKFKLEDLFDIKTTKGVDKNKINVFDKGTFEFIGRSSVNNGVQGYVEKLGYEPNEENTLSIVQVGKTCCLYRDKKWYASQNIFKLIPKFDHLNKIHYFIRTIIDKNLIYYEPAYVCPKLSDLEDLEIELPISSTIDPTHKYHPGGYVPDWKYMEDYIAQIKANHIAKIEDNNIAQIEAYLKATGLDNYELIKEEKEALQAKKEMKEFRIGDLFHKINSSFYGKPNTYVGRKKHTTEERDSTHTIPLTCAKKGNNGVMYYGEGGMFSAEPNCISVIRDGVISAGLVYAHKDPVGVLSHSYLIKGNDNVSFEVLEYCSTMMTKVIYPRYSRDYPPLWENRVENENIKLPIISTSKPTPDWQFMETYMKAIEKTIIKEVVDYKNEVLKITQEICGELPPAKLEDPDTLKEDEIKQIKKLLQKGMKKTELLELLKGNLDSM